MNSTSSRSPRCVHAGRCSQVQIGSLNDVGWEVGGWVDRQEDWGNMWKPTVAKKQRIIVRLTGCQWEIFYVKKQKTKTGVLLELKRSHLNTNSMISFLTQLCIFLTIKYIFFFGFCFFFPAKARARDCGICCHRINPFVSSGLLNTLCLLLFPTGRKDWGICVWVGYV